MIPKILLQTSKYDLPDYVKHLWKNYMSSDWKHEHFNDDQIIQYFRNNSLSEFPDIEKVWLSFNNGAHKSDLFRYYYLYINGGVYADVDIMVCLHLDDIISNEVDHIFVTTKMIDGPGRNKDTGLMFNGFICCKPKSPILYNLLKHAYTTKQKHLERNYFLFCEMMHVIVSNLHEQNENIKFFHEDVSANNDETYTYDNDKLIFTHYYAKKVIPQSYYIGEKLIKLLSVYDVGEKIRLGENLDGGYIAPKIAVENSIALFSYGISRYISFDESYIESTDFKKKAYGYDHTIDGVDTKYPENFILFIEGLSSSKTSDTDNFLSHYDKLGIEGRVLLKIDVEAAEYEFFENTNIKDIADRALCIIIEFHHLDNETFRNQFLNIVERLNKHFYLCHIHGNNHDSVFKIHKGFNVYWFPKVVELTFMLKEEVNNVSYSKEEFPTILDYPNKPSEKDIDLLFINK